jgi:hypothetical protein
MARKVVVAQTQTTCQAELLFLLTTSNAYKRYCNLEDNNRLEINLAMSNNIGPPNV